MYTILTINLGATSTKLNIYHDEDLCSEITLRHTDESIERNPLQRQQLQMRHDLIIEALAEHNISIDDVSAVVIRATFGRAGSFMKRGGTYLLRGEIYERLISTYQSDAPVRHAAIIALPLAYELIGSRDIPVFLVDPASVDEFEDVARITGTPLMMRSPRFHALNQKATAHKAASELGKSYKDLKLIVAHLGGGVSIGAHSYGRVIDSSNGGGDQDGPFTPNRSGRLPIAPLVEMCFSGEYTKEQITEMVISKGGFTAHTGYSDVRIVEKNALNGDKNSELVLEAFVYQVCKEIGEMYSVLGFEADGIVLTGGLAYSDWIVGEIRKKIDKLCPVFVYPGEEEGPAMAAGALRVLRGQEQAITITD